MLEYLTDIKKKSNRHDDKDYIKKNLIKNVLSSNTKVGWPLAFFQPY